MDRADSGKKMVVQSTTISIVDDDEDVRFALESFLRSAGCAVCTFDCAEAFLCSLKGGAPDCLITDLNMPGMDGLVLQEELNRLGRTFPVIVMTAFPSLEAEKQSAKLGAIAFLNKPIDPEQLLEQVVINLRDSDDLQPR